MIKVSVIVPCYKAEKYLEACLESLLAQTLKECEFIFVDDGSPDGTPALLDSFAGRDSRVRVIHQENRGPGGARNHGIAEALGEYIGFVDADDTVSENYYEVLYGAAVRHDADIAWTNLLRCCKGEVKHYKVHFTEERVIEAGEPRPLSSSNHPVTKIYRRSLFDDSSLLFPERCFYEDIRFTIPMLFAAGRIVQVPGAVYYYASENSSTTRRKQDARLQRDRYEALLHVRDFLKDRDIPLPRRLRQIRRREWSAGRICLFKIKDCGSYDIYKLFDLLPVWFSRH